MRFPAPTIPELSSIITLPLSTRARRPPLRPIMRAAVSRRTSEAEAMDRSVSIEMLVALAATRGGQSSEQRQLNHRTYRRCIASTEVVERLLLDAKREPPGISHRHFTHAIIQGPLHGAHVGDEDLVGYVVVEVVAFPP